MHRVRFLFTVALALAAAVVLAQVALPQSGRIFTKRPAGALVQTPAPIEVIRLDFSKTDDQGKVQLNGAAKFADNRLRLTDDGNQAASVFLKAPMQLSDYLASFDFEVRRVDASDTPADGFMFLAQAFGVDKIGAGGGAIAFTRGTGIPRDEANGGFLGYNYGVDFNSWPDQGLGGNPEIIGLDVMGTRTRFNATPFPHVDQGVLHADIRVTPNRLTVAISGGRQNLNRVLFLTSPPWMVGFFRAPGPLYFGFTGGTGGARQIADILNFRLQTGLPPAAWP